MLTVLLDRTVVVELLPILVIFVIAAADGVTVITSVVPTDVGAVVRYCC